MQVHPLQKLPHHLLHRRDLVRLEFLSLRSDGVHAVRKSLFVPSLFHPTSVPSVMLKRYGFLAVTAVSRLVDFHYSSSGSDPHPL